MIRPGITPTISGILWAASIAADAGGISERIWRPLLTAAASVTVITAVHAMLARHARSNAAVTRAALTRPFDRTGPIARIMDTGPMRKLASVSPRHAGETGPLPSASALRKPHGQHASPR